MSNWPGNVDYGHSNFTMRTPRVSKYDGKGAWAPNSTKIPLRGWIGGAVAVIVLFAVCYVGAAAGYQ